MDDVLKDTLTYDDIQTVIDRMVNIYWLHSKDRKLSAQGTSLLIGEAMNIPSSVRMAVLDQFERKIDEQT